MGAKLTLYDKSNTRWINCTAAALVAGCIGLTGWAGRNVRTFVHRLATAVCHPLAGIGEWHGGLSVVGGLACAA